MSTTSPAFSGPHLEARQKSSIELAAVPFLTFFVRAPQFTPAHGARNKFCVQIRVRADPATSHFVPSFLSEVTDLSLRIGTKILPKQSRNGKSLFSYCLKFETPPLKALGAATITGSFTASVVIALAYHHATSLAKTGTASAFGTPNLFYP
ncbi:hypothetical protein NC652_037915 [Populus alba x Populus x berolinensis]|nr:hypothetical protein NC652_037915 [Populus alba x Populus x berolinensis]